MNLFAGSRQTSGKSSPPSEEVIPPSSSTQELTNVPPTSSRSVGVIQPCSSKHKNVTFAASTVLDDGAH